MINRLFSINGRMSLITYWIYCVLAGLAVVLLSNAEVNSPVLETAVLALMLVVFPVFIIIQSIKRMHDLSKSGWFLLIPVYNVIMLFLAEGTKGENKYGGTANENRTGSMH